MAKSICSIDDCERPHYARAVCRRHYDVARHGGLEPIQGRQTICSIEGCERPFYGKTWCRLHWERNRKHGDPLIVKRPRRSSCSIDGCDKKHAARGYCALHYGRSRTGTDMTKPAKKYFSTMARDGEGNKRCTKCELWRPEADFTTVKTTGDRFSWYCRPCRADMRREVAYNLKPGQYEEMLLAQGGCCAICGTDDPGVNKSWNVDHDHSCCAQRNRSCGKCVRGLLCLRCNVGIGQLKDDAAIIQRAADYVLGFRELS